ncbi:hypothetical protein [Dyadobacter sp. NIV53]|nr:hypothetical protein [Dyadobacter sp. NIV53]
MIEKADFTIKNELEYEGIMNKIELLMDKGEANLTILESDQEYGTRSAEF